MAEPTQVDSPVLLVRKLLRSTWNTVLMVYYANSISWRALKSGALTFFGFFLWSASNLLLSYQPRWTLLNYVMAYGFVLIVYGPFHHLVVIPIALKWRRGSDDRRRSLGKRLPNASLVVFLAIVVVLGTFPPGVMAFEFSGELGGTGVDINPDLACVKATSANGTTTVHCHLTRSEGIDRVVVESGGRTVLVDDDPPFDFTVREDQLEEVVGNKQFQVVLQDERGNTLRRYTRTLGMVPER
ncbi:MAG: hypothetical protein R3324_18740 [Halobacteriales archaeon]|nr:hypothetical protein [Halobacteriales archaeon]